MTTTFLTKGDLVARTKQTNKLDKRYEQLRANAEFNKVSEFSFEDAMKRQYKPIVEAIDSKLKHLLAIELPKKEASTNMERGDESEGRLTNLPASIFESYISKPNRDEIYGITEGLVDGTYYLGRDEYAVALNLSKDRKSRSWWCALQRNRRTNGTHNVKAT